MGAGTADVARADAGTVDVEGASEAAAGGTRGGTTGAGAAAGVKAAASFFLSAGEVVAGVAALGEVDAASGAATGADDRDEVTAEPPGRLTGDTDAVRPGLPSTSRAAYGEAEGAPTRLGAASGNSSR